MKRIFLVLFLFVCVLFFTGGLFLKSGIHIDGFHAGSATLSNISLKWQNKLELRIESLVIDLLKDESGKQLPGLNLVDKALPLIQGIDRLFSKISIQEFMAGEVSGSLLYEASLGHLSLSSQLVDLRAIIRLDGAVLSADIEDLRSGPLHSHASGELRFDINDKSGSGQFVANLADSLPVTLEVTVDDKQLSFQGKEAGKITDITPFVDLFGLDHTIQKWITDYLTGSRYNLKSFAGNFPWNDPLVLLDTLFAEVRVDDCEYTFAPGLEAIKTAYTDVVFKKGVLTITPHNSTFYGQDGEDSWLDINFNDPANMLLTVHILTHAKANQDIVTLLRYYDISLPFRQTEGEVDADLTLSVNLNSALVTAHGVFLIDEGRIDYCLKNYGVKGARILLDNTKITLEQLHVSSEQTFAADIAGSFDVTTETADLDITLREFSFEVGKLSLVLDGSETEPTLHYTIRPEGATIAAEASSWRIGVLPLKLGPFTSHFSLGELSGHISSASLSCPPFVSTEISGTVSLKEQRIDLKCNLLQYNGKGLQLEKSPKPLIIRYDKELTIRSEKESQWLLNNIPVTLYPSEFKFSDNIYSITSGRISYGKFFDSNISGHYNQLTNQGEFLLEDLDIKKESIGHFLTPDNAISIEVDGREETLLLKVPELDMEITSGENKSWSLLFKDLGAVYDHSPLLQRYLVDGGILEVASKDGVGYRFSADIPYGYSLLVKDTIPVDRYQVYGESSDNGFHATVNKDVQIGYDDGLTITSQDVSLNIPAVINLLKDLPESGDTDFKDPKGVRCTLEASNTSLVITPERQLLGDKITLEYIDGKTSLQLEHGQGSIALDIEREEFSLAGEGLDDVFMDGLLPGSEFRTGTMSVAAKGYFDDFTAMVKIEDTIMSDLKTLNNVLALVNTIPALVTFSLPSYSTEGLPVDSVIAGFKMKDGVATFNSLDLESPEISIIGDGWIDVFQKKIEMDLNLITRAKKNMNKIPLVGYIMVGTKKRPSITVQVSGDLFDPKVEHSTFREVATEPFYMLYRTLALPAYLVAPMFSSDEGEQEEEEDVGGENYLKNEDKEAEE
jgi:AsmA-like C-terminal region/Protein of unknown function